jgi:NADPH2:quinone reductase
MRAIEFTAFGEPAAVLHLTERPQPTLKPGQVLVRMHTRPINPSDLFQIRGQYGILPRLPAVPGMEGAGIVEALGEGVTQLHVGQQVVPLGPAGTWQEYLAADAQALLPVPNSLSGRDAAMLVANPTTAWLLLHDVLHVQPGAWVVQNAANSAVGYFVVQLCKRLGYRSINVVRRHDVIDELRAAGADEVICEADEDVVERVRAITSGKGVRYAIDSVAGASGSRLAQTLGPGGILAVFGAISREPLTLDAGALLFRGVTIRGWWLVHWLRTATPADRETLFTTLMPLIADGTLRAPVAAEFDLAHIADAVAMAESTTRHGKVLLTG